MKFPIWPKKRWLRTLLILVALVLLPYGFSRVASLWRYVVVRSANTSIDGVAPSRKAQLRVACYNIAHGRGTVASNWEGGSQEERATRLGQIADVLRDIDADIVVLNEVDFDCSWSHGINQARDLAEKAGYPYWVEQRNLDFRILVWKWRFGNAVLSKYPITAARAVPLPGDSRWKTVLAGKKRGVLCDVLVGDQRIQVIGAHLSHRSESVRVKSAAMMAKIAGKSRYPTIVAGDLNSTPPGFPHSARDANGNNALDALDRSQYFVRSPQMPPIAASAMTFSSFQPRMVIDWILIPRDWTFLRYSVESTELSDHRPVWADVAPTESPNDPE
jgi:endonuclease/exonuclease/phosphatase family metal-dependent hydrolase